MERAAKAGEGLKYRFEERRKGWDKKNGFTLPFAPPDSISLNDNFF
jgi:hypothetical protein